MTLRRAFALQASACATLGSPLTARVLSLAGERLRPGDSLADRLFAWPGDITYNGASVPLRLAGGLHALVLGGADAPLAAFYADPGGLGDDAAWDVLAAAMARHRAGLMHWLDSPPQTNEVRRAAVLVAVGHWLAARFGKPLVLSELGASAGLNLLWDRYALDVAGQRFGPTAPVLSLAPDWAGAPPPAALPVVAERAGCDLNPLDPVRDRLRVLSYIWPDQQDRLARTRAALDLAARHPPGVVRADAADWLEERLRRWFPGHLHLVYHTVAWQYFPTEVQARCDAALARAGAAATVEAPLAHFGMEADPAGHGTRLSLRLWAGGASSGEPVDMGWADAHGRAVRWSPPEI